MNDYYISIYYSEEDNAYVADIPDLEYCSAFGESPQEALEEVMKARDAWLLAAKDANKEIPRARFKPVHYQLG